MVCISQTLSSPSAQVVVEGGMIFWDYDLQGMVSELLEGSIAPFPENHPKA